MDTNKIKTLLAEVKAGTKTEEDATKELMGDYGKALTKEQGKSNDLQTKLDDATNKVKTYETEIATLKESSKDSDDWKTKFENLDKKIKEQEAEAKAKADDELLTNNITELFEDKKFTSDYAKNGLITDIKSELNKPENKGKGISDIFASLTKDKTGIFESETTIPNMPGVGASDNPNPTDLESMTFEQYKAYRKSQEK